jgi:hypothetical protein
VRSRVVDPKRNSIMTEAEERARQHFERLKTTLPTQSPRWWRKDFKCSIDKFIKRCLVDKETLTSNPSENEEEEEFDRMCLHGLRRLVAGAVQEWELVQQPNHAAMCAKLDGALVWQGRGYVCPILHAISSLQSLQLSFQG